MKAVYGLGIIAVFSLAALIALVPRERLGSLSDPVKAGSPAKVDRTAEPAPSPPQSNLQNLSDSDLTAKASLAVIAACTGWQLGTIQRSEIMNAAKEILSRQGHDPSTVDWERAIKVAVQLDQEEKLGCLE